MKYEEVKNLVEKYPDAFQTNKIVIEELEKIEGIAKENEIIEGIAKGKILQSVENIKKALFDGEKPIVA